MANHSLAQAIGDQGWRALARQLDYKAIRHGGLWRQLSAAPARYIDTVIVTVSW
jgi:hypothetical protein